MVEARQGGSELDFADAENKLLHLTPRLCASQIDFSARCSDDFRSAQVNSSVLPTAGECMKHLLRPVAITLGVILPAGFGWIACRAKWMRQMSLQQQLNK